MAGEIQLNGTTAITESSGVISLGTAVNLTGADQIVQVKTATTDTQSTVGTNDVTILDLEFATKNANSKFLAIVTAQIGGDGDANAGYHGICLTVGSTPTVTDYMERGASSVTRGVNDALWFVDVGMVSSQYSMSQSTFSAEKITTIAAGTTISVAYWCRGATNLYINRSRNRENESGVTKLIVYEIAQ